MGFNSIDLSDIFVDLMGENSNLKSFNTFLFIFFIRFFLFQLLYILIIFKSFYFCKIKLVYIINFKTVKNKYSFYISNYNNIRQKVRLYSVICNNRLSLWRNILLRLHHKSFCFFGLPPSLPFSRLDFFFTSVFDNPPFLPSSEKYLLKY